MRNMSTADEIATSNNTTEGQTNAQAFVQMHFSMTENINQHHNMAHKYSREA